MDDNITFLCVMIWALIFDFTRDCFSWFRNYFNTYRNYMLLNPALYYLFIVMKSLLLYHLSDGLTKEAASLQSLIFITLYFLKVRNVLDGFKVLSGQLFWILAGHILKHQFIGNVMMSILMFIDPDVLAVQDGLLATHVYLFMFRWLPLERDTLCLVVSSAIAVVWYAIWCKKYITDVGFFVNLYFAFQSWFPKLTNTAVTVILAIWNLLVWIDGARVRF